MFDNPAFWEPPTTEVSEPTKQVEGNAEDAAEHLKDKTELADGTLRDRGKKQRLRVTFGNGDVVCEITATATMIQVIRKLGIGRVASVGMEVCHVPLVSREIVPRYARWTKEVGDGWYLMAQSDTRQKYMQLKAIVAQLEEDVQVEMGDFDQFVSAKNEGERKDRKSKLKLSVTFADGFSVCSIDHQLVYAETVRRIGIDKVKKTHLQISGKPIIAPERKYNNQVQLFSGSWLTVPPQIKDKYKILRILSSMTHTPYEVKILE